MSDALSRLELAERVCDEAWRSIAAAYGPDLPRPEITLVPDASLPTWYRSLGGDAARWRVVLERSAHRGPVAGFVPSPGRVVLAQERARRPAVGRMMLRAALHPRFVALSGPALLQAAVELLAHPVVRGRVPDTPAVALFRDRLAVPSFWLAHAALRGRIEVLDWFLRSRAEDAGFAELVEAFDPPRPH